MSKYQALIDAMEAVTSTNWEHDGGADVFEVDVGVLVASTMETEDAAYIAEANPATIRALLDDLERAEKALAAIAQQAQEPVAWMLHLAGKPRCASVSKPSLDGYHPDFSLRPLVYGDTTPPAPQVPAPVDERDAWLPIESAPNDGTPILAAQAGLHPETGEPFVPCSVILDGDKVQVFCDSDDDEWVSLSDWRLTHWQPLPPAPQTKGQP